MMNIRTFKEALKRKSVEFVEKTYLQGIREAVRAKTIFAKIFWVVILIGVYIIAAYQIYQATFPNSYDGVSTRMEVLKKGKLFYPPLTLCYSPWIQWVDTNKVKQLGIDKQALMFAISYIDKVYTTLKFDEKNSEKTFRGYLSKLGNAEILQFFRSVAYDSPPGLADYDDDLKFGLPYVKGNKLCYDGNINEYLHNREEQNVNLGKERIYLFFKASEKESYRNFKFFHDDELVDYTRDIFRMDESFPVSDICLSRYERLLTARRSVRFPSTVEVLQDGNGLAPHPMFSEYEVKVDVNVRRWKNKKSSSCTENQQSYPCNAGCVDTRKKGKASCNCVESLAVNMTFDSPIQRRCMFYFQKGAKKLGKSHNDNKPCLIVYNNGSCNTAITSSYLPLCGSKTCPTKGCEVWYLDTTEISTASFEAFCNESHFNMRITLTYPLAESIIVSVEVEDGTQWYHVMSKVGGLLAVWMGASILSVLHMLYVFCDCTEPENRLTSEVQMPPELNMLHLQHRKRVHKNVRVGDFDVNEHISRVQ